ncbi:hypothetical protein HUB98_19565 [Paenibacillus barcinonensis]|uniref:FTP domain-containing protein n=1 Tax=Paenibacillus barcinonensis TaxID=198119 RepID=A0A2V4W860_PAEBA|nr:hypothetical protein [Paenibacillus barcinonensis]PYE47325.1 hypothetical protein DFQ00_11465 [Paenibacillus barcinonensis]QKS58224.1 hypothetical protein HUB98_19565 [Paenibacillus barcinonensis]
MRSLYNVFSTMALAGIIATISVAPFSPSASAAKAKTEASTTVSAAASSKTTPAPAAVIKKVEQTLKTLTQKTYKLDKGSYLDGIGWDFNVLGTPFPSQLLVDLKGNIHSGFIQENEISFFFEKNKLSYTQENAAIEDLAPQDIEAAEAVFGKLDLPMGELQGVVLQHKGKKHIYEFMYATEKYGTWIGVDQSSHQVVAVNAIGLSDDIYNKGQEAVDEYYRKMKAITARQLQETGVAQAKLLLGIDLNGHTVKKEAFPSDRAVFTKEGAPTVEGRFNSDGGFYSIHIVYN